MKRLYNLWMIALLGGLFLAGCEDDNENATNSGSGILHISAMIDGMNQQEAETRFYGGQDVGFWLSTTEVHGALNNADLAQNIRFSQSAGGLVSEPRTRCNGGEQLSIYGYSPFDYKASENPESYIFEIDSRQDTLIDHPHGNKKCDFLWTKQNAEYNGSEPVSLSFHHLMSKIILYVKSSSATPGSLTGGTLNICNVQTKAQINLDNGELLSTGTKEHITSMPVSSVPSDYEIAREVILVPQTIHTGEQFLDIRTQGNYSCIWKATRDLTFEAGKQVVMEVTVDEGECDVRIGEISEWKENDTPILGEAVEELPVFKIFDFYNRRGVQGIVIDVDETGTHGWIVSVDDEWLSWCSVEMGTYWPQAYDSDNSEANIEAVRAVDPTLESYPAMKWCDDKNTNGVTGWILPAENVLKKFTKLISDYDKWEQFNQAIEDCPVADDEKWTVYINWDDYGSSYFCHSSTLSSWDAVQVSGCSIMYGWYYGSYYQEQQISQQFVDWGGGDTEGEAYVRAFHKF